MLVSSEASDDAAQPEAQARLSIHCSPICIYHTISVSCFTYFPYVAQVFPMRQIYVFLQQNKTKKKQEKMLRWMPH